MDFLRDTGKQDRTGRAILFLNPTRLPLNEPYDQSPLVRAFWYNAHMCLESQVVQQMGATVIVFTKNIRYAHMDQKLLSMTASSLKGCVPSRMPVNHGGSNVRFGHCGYRHNDGEGDGESSRIVFWHRRMRWR